MQPGQWAIGFLFSGAIATAHAASPFTLNLTADGTSRWYDYFSDAFAQIDQPFNGSQVPDGFFQISTLPVLNQFGAFDVFPFESAFSDFGNVSFASGTNVGVETRNITGLTLAPNTYVVAESILGSPTSTLLGALSGTVTTFNGQVSGLNLTVPITFRFDGSGIGSTMPLDYAGEFTLSNNRFSLQADGTNPTPFGDMRLRWDVTGSINNLSPIPEPSAWALMLGGLVTTSAIARRRRRQ